MKPDLQTTLAGVRLENPLILAAGILGETGKSLARVAMAGAGAVTTKSIGREPRPGNGNPVIVELEFGLLNALGLPNPGIEEYAHELRHLSGLGVPVVGSIFGGDAAEFAFVGRRMEEYGVSILELNLSCPNAKGYGTSVGADPRFVGEIASAVKAAVRLPVFAKLTPNTDDIVALGRAAVEGGCDGLVAANTVRAMAINPELGLPVLRNAIGGYSGPAVKPIHLRCVFELSRARLGVPIVGVGGIATGRDVVEYLMAGADAVQVGTSLVSGGPEAFTRIRRELEAFMDENRFKALDQMKGLALRT